MTKKKYSIKELEDAVLWYASKHNNWLNFGIQGLTQQIVINLINRGLVNTNKNNQFKLSELGKLSLPKGGNSKAIKKLNLFSYD